MMNLNTNRAKHSMIWKYIFSALSFLVVMPTWSSGWDAKTRLTNTVFTDADVKVALNKGLSPAFQPVLILTGDQANIEREQVSQRLAEQASAFAAASLQNASRRC
jgi:hypothetical protein